MRSELEQRAGVWRVVIGDERIGCRINRELVGELVEQLQGIGQGTVVNSHTGNRAHGSRTDDASNGGTA